MFTGVQQLYTHTHTQRLEIPNWPQTALITDNSSRVWIAWKSGTIYYTLLITFSSCPDGTCETPTYGHRVGWPLNDQKQNTIRKFVGHLSCCDFDFLHFT